MNIVDKGNINNLDTGITFGDVLLQPAYSEVLPNEVDTTSYLSNNIKLNIPIVSAAMDTVTGSKMAAAMLRSGGTGVIHRNQSIDNQVNSLSKVKKQIGSDSGVVGAAIGFYGNAFDRAKALVAAGADFIVIDTAHGDTKAMFNMVQKIKADKNFTNIDIIAGNIATGSAAKSLIEAGADAVKVGIGPGSICTTRVVSGVGVPQITAISNVFAAAGQYNIPIIADGGIRYIGDIAKAIAAGASTVMLGSLLAGTDQAIGDIVEVNGRKYKAYRGMGAKEVLNSTKAFSSDRYFHTANKVNKLSSRLVSEGVSGLIDYKGSVVDILEQIISGLRQSMFYIGAESVRQIWQKGRFIKITSAGLTESHPHDIHAIKD
ncbi:MAG: IMP dehydrogenase [Bifidobacteriaceae bacterium]|nr:IMP dehydrogenase [Bifidobacteriaceae bacterium]